MRILEDANYTIKETAAYFKVSTKTIDRRIKSGKLKCYKEGQNRRIKGKWILEYEGQLIAETS